MRLDSILSSGFGHGETQQWSRLERAYVRMYTFTAGRNRTAGRDGQGMGRLWLMTIMTPFNSAGAEEKDGNSCADMLSRSLSRSWLNSPCIQRWLQTSQSQ